MDSSVPLPTPLQRSKMRVVQLERWIVALGWSSEHLFFTDGPEWNGALGGAVVPGRTLLTCTRSTVVGPRVQRHRRRGRGPGPSRASAATWLGVDPWL